MNTLTHPSFPIEPNGWVHYPAPVPPLCANRCPMEYNGWMRVYPAVRPLRTPAPFWSFWPERDIHGRKPIERLRSCGMENNGWAHAYPVVRSFYALQDFWFRVPLLFEHMSDDLCSNCGLTFNADATALVRAKTAPCDLVTSFTDPLIHPDEQPAHEVWYTLAEGKHWCLNHKRPATHVDRRGWICCDPKLGGILLPCDTRPTA